MFLLPPSLSTCRTIVPLPHAFSTRHTNKSLLSHNKRTDFQMGEESSPLKATKSAIFRLCNVSRKFIYIKANRPLFFFGSFETELLEVRAENPSFHVLFIPGNPGIVSFYKEFLERVYEKLEGCASVTGIGHIAQSKKNWESGRLFSLQDQIDHKVDFIKQEIQTEVPIVLVGHSIGSYISLEVFKRTPEQVKYCTGLYPFLSLNKDSLLQSFIGKIAASQVLSTVLSTVVGTLGLLPNWASRLIVRISLGKSSSATAIEACHCLLQYHTIRNVLFMAKKEFEKLAEVPDWTFIRRKQDQVSFLFGLDDHWGPLSLLEEISKQVPATALTIEREGHTHGFCCTVAGSVWVADHVVSLIKHQFMSKQ